MLQKAQVEMQNSNKVKLQTLQQVENQLKMQSESEDTNSNSDQASVESQPKVEELNENVEVAMVVNEKTKQNINKRKVLTIATKLKLTRVQPTPAVAESSPKFYSPRVKSQSKGRSIMVGGLFRGLTPIDIVEYFGGFGDVIDHNEPQGSLEQQEGTKYMFLKFKHSHTVDNVIGKLQYTCF